METRDWTVFRHSRYDQLTQRQSEAVLEMPRGNPRRPSPENARYIVSGVHGAHRVRRHLVHRMNTTLGRAEARVAVRIQTGADSRVLPARILSIALVTLWLSIAVVLTLRGFPYYREPLQTRVFTEQHERFAPSGTEGIRLGLAGCGCMVAGVGSYMLRKRWRVLERAGQLRYWLQVHIFLCTLGPFLILLHSSFRVAGLVAIAFWSMMLVVASGLFGRYVYARIPKTVGGRFRSVVELEAERASVRAARHDLPLAQQAAAEQRERELTHQIGRVIPMQRLFRYWHLFHLPLALVMLLILAIHVGVAVLLGYAWPF